MTKPSVAFRADGNSQIGLGHIHRSLALAGMLADAFDVSLLTRNPSARTRQMVEELNGHLHVLNDACSIRDEAVNLVPLISSFDIVVLDGYEFDGEYQRTIRSAGPGLVCIDDLHRDHFVADVIINHAGNAQPELYDRELYTRLCLGIPYLLVKAPFLEAARMRSGQARTPEIFISIGGADMNNDTLFVLKRLAEKQVNLPINVVVGEAYRHHEALQQFMATTKLHVVRYVNLSTSEMLSLMIKCAVAICAPSGEAYEYLCVGGELYVHQTADNQSDIKRFLLDAGLAFSFGDFRVTDKRKIEATDVRQASVVDGNSASRLLAVFNTLVYQKRSAVRKANEGDLVLLFHWANDPLTRRLSFNSEPISLESHRTWFNKKNADPNAYLYIFEFENTPVGQIRFDISESAAITYALDEHYRGMGLGVEIVRKGIKKFRSDSGFTGPIIAYVKRENMSSKRVFQKLGFNFVHDDKFDAEKYILNYERY